VNRRVAGIGRGVRRVGVSFGGRRVMVSLLLQARDPRRPRFQRDGSLCFIDAAGGERRGRRGVLIGREQPHGERADMKGILAWLIGIPIPIIIILYLVDVF
jgi:hypothetical protein